MSKRNPNKLPTQKEIARLAGVSQVTVNAVLNASNHTRTKPETRDHILAIAKQLNYKIQQHARFMRTGKSNSIAVISTMGIVETGYVRLNLALSAVRDAGFFPSFYDTKWGGDNFDETWDEVLQSRPEGIVFAGGITLMTPEVKARIAELDIPIVSLSGPQLDQIPLLIPDYRDGFRRLTRHVLEAGRREITLIMREPTTYQKAYRWQDERRLGVLEAAQEESMDLKLVDLSVKRPERGEKSHLVFTDAKLADNLIHGYEFGRKAIAEGLHGDTWMFFNDAWALGALRALGEAKVAVPERMAITGCDGENSVKYGYIPITTLVQPIRQIAAEGVKLLVEMIRTKESRKDLVRRLPCELRIGATV